MKHVNKNGLGLSYLSNKTGILASFFVMLSVLVLALNFAPGANRQVYAANTVVASCKKVLGQTSVSDEQIQKAPIYKDCAIGYNAGYNNPTNNDLTQVCNTTLTYMGMCENGYKQGQLDRKASSTTPQPTASQIATKAAAACKAYSTQDGVSSSTKKDNYDSCVMGYTNQFKGQDTTAACDSAKETSACLKGHESAVNGKAAVPGTASNPQAAATPAGDTTASGTSSSDNTVDCESHGGLAWILCPVISGISNAVDSIYSTFIEPLLKTTPVDIHNTDVNGDHTFAIWSNFRVYGDIFLVVALLVVVFGESIGGGLIDAYAAKKILPRLLIATVAINLSIYIIAIAVDLTNVLGNGVAGLIEEPFKSVAGGFHLQLGNGGAGIGIAALVGSGGAIWSVGSAGAAGAAGAAAGAAGAAAAIGVMLEFFLVFVLIPMFFIFIAIMATLLIRKALILLLILSAPIAFALYCLPNTEKYFRKWFELLGQTLMIYPIIAVIFALSNVMAVTMSKAPGFTGALSDLMAIIALIIPLVLIPFSFKIAGGLLGRVGELAHGYGKRGVEGIKGDAKDPDSWRNRTRRNNAALRNEAGLSQKALATRFKNPGSAFSTSGRQLRKDNQKAAIEGVRLKLGRQTAESDTMQLVHAKNDQYQLAVSDPKMAEEMYKKADSPGQKAAWQQAIAAARLTPQNPATRLVAANAVAQSGFHYAAGQKGYNQLAETMSSITGAQLQYHPETGDVMGVKADDVNAGAFANAMNNAQYNFRTAGRFDMGGINNGSGYDFDGGVSKASGYTAGQAKTDTFVAGAEAKFGKEAVGADGKTVDQGTLTNLLAAKIASGTLDADQAGAWHAKLLDAKQSATGANKDEITKQLDALNAAAVGINNSPPENMTDQAMERSIRLSESIDRNNRAMRQTIDPNNIENQT